MITSKGLTLLIPVTAVLLLSILNNVNAQNQDPAIVVVFPSSVNDNGEIVDENGNVVPPSTIADARETPIPQSPPAPSTQNIPSSSAPSTGSTSFTSTETPVQNSSPSQSTTAQGSSSPSTGSSPVAAPGANAGATTSPPTTVAAANSMVPSTSSNPVAAPNSNTTSSTTTVAATGPASSSAGSNPIVVPGPNSVGTSPPTTATQAGQNDFTSTSVASGASNENQPSTTSPNQTSTSGDSGNGAGAAGVGAAVGLFGRRDRSAKVERAPKPKPGNVVNRYPFGVTVPRGTKQYSENLDGCIRALAAEETDTGKEDWHLVSSKAAETPNKYNVVYDAEMDREVADDVTRKLKSYVGSGRMDRDISTKCKEKDVKVVSSGERSRTVAEDAVSVSGKGSGKSMGTVLGVIGALAALALLAGLLVGAKRRRDRTSSEDDAYSRSVFPTSVEPDIEAGDPTDARRTYVDEPHGTAHATDIAPIAAPAAVAGAAAAGMRSRDSSHTSRSSARDGSGNYMSAIGDHDDGYHPHDYLIGQGPVTSETPRPPPNYVVPLSSDDTSARDTAAISPHHGQSTPLHDVPSPDYENPSRTATADDIPDRPVDTSSRIRESNSEQYSSLRDSGSVPRSSASETSWGMRDSAAADYVTLRQDLEPGNEYNGDYHG